MPTLPNNSQLNFDHTNNTDQVNMTTLKTYLNNSEDSQPLPTPYSESKPSVTAVIIEECPEILKSDFLLRLEKGIKTYGTPLQPFNGRDALVDLYEEVLDGCQYAKQCLLENPDSIIFKCLYDGLICMAQSIKNTMLDQSNSSQSSHYNA